jgi:hypothetical protein
MTAGIDTQTCEGKHRRKVVPSVCLFSFFFEFPWDWFNHEICEAEARSHLLAEGNLQYLFGGAGFAMQAFGRLRGNLNLFFNGTILLRWRRGADDAKDTPCREK